MKNQFHFYLLMCCVFIYFPIQAFANLQVTNSSNIGSGLALNLSGADDYVEIPSNSDLQFGGQSFTVECWVKLNSTPDWGDVIIGKWNNTAAESTNEWMIAVNSIGNPFFVVEEGYVQNYVTPMEIMEVGRWYHLAVVKSPGAMLLKMNGVEISSYFGGNPNLNATNSPLRIGNSASGGNDADITIDEVRIWSGGIADINLRAWMCKKLTADHPQYSDLLSYYRFDEGSGPDVNDYGIGNNYGTPVNSPQWENSGAPIGDESNNIYNPPFNSQIVPLSHPDGDFIRLMITDGPPDGVHVYRVDAAPNVTTSPTGFDGLSEHYYGVFMVRNNNVFSEYTLTFGYDGSGYETTDDVQVAYRSGNDATSWTVQNGSINAGLNHFTANYVTAEIREFILESDGGTSCSSFPPNTVTAGSSTNLCPGEDVLLSAETGYTYLWNTSETTESIIVSTAGDYTVTITDALGCAIVSDPISVTIKNLITDFTTPNQVTYLLQPIETATVDFLAATAGSINTYEWDFGDGNTSADMEPSHTYANPGFYEVSLTVTDDEGCQQSLTKTAYVQVWLVFPSTNVSPTGVIENITGASFNGAYSGCIAIQNGNGNGGGYVCITNDGINWTPAGTITTSSELTSIFLTGGFGYITGTNGLICVYNGTSWTQFNTGTTSPFYNCWFEGTNYGWAVGGNGTICIYNGTNWTATPTGLTNTFYGVWGYGTSSWAVGSGGVICVYNGSNWTQQTSGVTTTLTGVYFVNDMIGYACGYGGAILGTTNGGLTWNVLQAEGSLAWNLNAIWATDANNIVAVGDNGVVCISTNGGLTWELLSIGTNVDLLDVTVENCIGYCTGADGSVYQFAVPGCVPLPIELTDFTAELRNKTVALNWQTSTETDNDYFVIERSSDGGWFETLGIVEGAGTTSIPQSYQFTDPAPKYGVNYYRLKQVDFDGIFTYSKVIPILITAKEDDLVVFPNPVKDKATIILNSSATQSIKMLISDETGRWVSVQTFDVQRGLNELTLNVSALSAGIYFLSLQDMGDARTVRLIVEQ